GVSLAYPLSQIPMGLGSLIGVGAGSVLSIAIGANDKKTQSRILGNSNYLSIVIALVYTLLAWYFAVPLIKIMGGKDEALAEGVKYFKITAVGSIFWIHGLAGNMIIRAEGKMKSAALIMGFGLVVNLLFNYIFMGMLKMGVEGAAWGTNIGMLIYTLSSFIYFSMGKSTFDAKPFKIEKDFEIIKKINSLGISSLIMTVMTLIQGIVVLNAISKYGSVYDLAFYGAVYRIFTFVLTPVFGLMRALQPVVGINFGANNYERVISSFKIFAVGATIVMFPFWIISMTTPSIFLSLIFINQNFDINSLINFRIMMGLLPALPIIFMTMTFYPAINKGKPAALMGITRQLFFYVPIMSVIPRLYGIQWVYYGSTAIDIFIIIWVIFMIKKEFSLLRIQGIPATE
ncbi:MAG: polysaccharide biosynthesis C-terminal domain-containing protein, partial [Fusobacteriaceae bacterium]|nr:polysaccharide biosynthesis C-terminal domain-containing protein [Fusobacteriaceae bacterium]